MSRRSALLPFLLIPPVTAAAVLAGFTAGIPWLLPPVSALPGCAGLWLGLSRGSRPRALALVLVWAVTLGGALTWLSFADNDTAARVIPMGTGYREEMRQWIETGVGRESDPARFVPQHLAHLGLFAALSAATAGGAGLVMGAALMGYMSFYVGDLALAAQAGRAACGPAHVALVAWNPWSIVRVVSFIVLGVALAEPLLGRLTGRPAAPGLRRWLAAGLAGIAADLALKTLLAPSWRGMLAHCLG